MAKTGIKEYDELPSRIGYVDIDALRALYADTAYPGYLERFFSWLGLESVSERLEKFRQRRHRFANEKLQSAYIQEGIESGLRELRERGKI